LERLHQKVKALSLAGPQGVPQAVVAAIAEAKPAAVITQQPEPEELTDLQRQRKLIVGQFDRLRKMIEGDEQHTEFFNGAVADLAAAKTVEQLELVRGAMNEQRKGMKPLSRPVADELKRFVDLRIEELKGGAA
jgi:hypothetical protein